MGEEDIVLAFRTNLKSGFADFGIGSNSAVDGIIVVIAVYEKERNVQMGEKLMKLVHHADMIFRRFGVIADVITAQTNEIDLFFLIQLVDDMNDIGYGGTHDIHGFIVQVRKEGEAQIALIFYGKTALDAGAFFFGVIGKFKQIHQKLRFCRWARLDI